MTGQSSDELFPQQNLNNTINYLQQGLISETNPMKNIDMYVCMYMSILICCIRRCTYMENTEGYIWVSRYHIQLPIKRTLRRKGGKE